MTTDTYTYTARSAHDPSRVVTFTLQDHSLSVGLGAALEQLDEALRAGDEEGESERAQLVLSWLKPTTLWLLQRSTHSLVAIGDVYASSVDQDLTVKAWVRLGGLRLAPLTFTWGRVDNPEAAEAFVRELHERQESAGHPSPLKGPMDYWASWLAAGLSLAIMLGCAWRKRKTKQK